jgi:hypothetical protein
MAIAREWLAIRRLWLLVGICCIAGCSTQSTRLDEEIELVKRAALGELQDVEKQKLLAENHPVLLQLSDPNLHRLLRLFAELPDERLKELRDKKFLKWRYAELDTYRQRVFADVLKMNFRLLSGEDNPSGANRVLALLAKSDLGFAVVTIPSSGDSVVSCFVLWPDSMSPTWVGVANANALKAADSGQAHLLRLPMLKNFPNSPVPPVPAGARPPEEVPHLIPNKGNKSQLFTKVRSGELP